MTKELTIDTLFLTIKNSQILEDDNLNSLMEFSKNDITKKTVKKYIDMMMELHEKINSLDVNIEQKNQFKILFSLMASKFAESECKSLMLHHSKNRNKKYKELIDILENELQKERNDNNEIRKKYSEELRPEKVSIPGINLSLITKPDKILTNKECIELMNEMDLEDRELDEKFKRIGIPDEYKNKINRAYVKKSLENNNIIQKQSTIKK